MLKRIALFALVLACAATLATAATQVSQVRFLYEDGTPVTDINVGVYNEYGEMIGKIPPHPPGDFYMIPVSPGKKMSFEMDDPLRGSGAVMLERVIPSIYVEPLIFQIDPIQEQLQVPVNDVCAMAIPVAVPSVTAGTTDEATIDLEAEFCGTGVTSPGVWYSFTGTGTTVSADLCDGGTNYDSKLSIYCLDCIAPLCVDGNDDFCGLQSGVSVCTEVGATYLVLVHGFGGQTGPFSLTLGENGVGCTGGVVCTPPPPVGACCDCDAPPFNCEELTADDCAVRGGQYQGDDTECVGTAGVPLDYISTNVLPIPDNDPAGLTDTIDVLDSVAIGDVNVAVQIDHTWIGDLILTLVHPGGGTVTLWNRECSSNDNIDAVFDDDGGPVFCASPTTGFIAPESADGTPLSDLNGLLSDGTWSLFITDNAGADTGSLLGWTLSIDAGITTCADQNDTSCYLCEVGGDCEGKVTICHYPPGNPGNAHTILVGQPALPAHLAHGDTLGACPADDGNSDGSGPLDAEGGSTDSPFTRGTGAKALNEGR